MTSSRIGFIGMRFDDAATYARMVALYRDILRLPTAREDGDRSTRFVVGDGSTLHIYGPGDLDHGSFGDRTCVGLVVADVFSTRRELAAAGFEILDDPIQRDGIEAWFHYRAADGSVQEIIGPDADANAQGTSPSTIRRPRRG